MRKKRKHDDEKIEYESKFAKQAGYVVLICALLIFAIGLYMTLSGISSRGITQSRFGGDGHEVTLTGPVTLVISGMYLVLWLFARIGLKEKKRKKE